MTTLHTSSIDQAVDTIIEKTAGKIIIALPLGLGKPTQLINALYKRAQLDPHISLSILTALSLSRPKGNTDLEKRFLKDFVNRVYGDLEELYYLRDRKNNCLPNNVEVNEFFVQPASELSNNYSQQHYLNTNYTHAARDINNRKVNVVAQLIAHHPLTSSDENTESDKHDTLNRTSNSGHGTYSYSCNPEVILDLNPLLEKRIHEGETILRIGQVHHKLPFMGNSAEIGDSRFDIIIDDPSAQTHLINTPNMPVGMAEHFIGLHASALVKDGGTLQIGIGALGDAVTSALLLRQQNNSLYQKLLKEIDTEDYVASLVDSEGGRGGFSNGLYGCSEMFTYGLFKLFQAGIISRTVKDSLGRSICFHAGFFLGPNAFYQGLNELPALEKAKINMTNISYVNHLYGNELEKRLHRKDARFINTAFLVTLMGAAVSDQLDDGRILSGVGGQYNFVAQAHELEGARSIILVRAARTKNGVPSSNLIWNYAHNTIPRHLRDIVVTEYGIADLRSKNDAEVIAAMINIADSRFQSELLEEAKSAGKIANDYRVPEIYCHNTPERLNKICRQYKSKEVFADFPLGCDFNQVEQELIKALSWLKTHVRPAKMFELARNSIINEDTAHQFFAHLKHMHLSEPQTLKEKLYRQLVLASLNATQQ